MSLNPPSPGFASASVFFAASAWGLYWIPIRYLEQLGFTGAWPVVMLNLPAALVLMLVVLSRWQRNRQFQSRAWLIGLFTGLAFGLYATGLIYSSVVRVTLLFYLTPVWATLIGMIWLGEKAHWSRWAAIVSGLLGLGLLMSGGGNMPLNIGDLFGFFSGIFWAIGGALILRFGAVPLESSTMGQLSFTCITALVLGALLGGAALPPAALIAQALPLSALVSLLVILPSLAVLFWASRFLFPGRVGLLMMTEALVAVITASLFLPEEVMSALEWAGAILIMGACFAEVLFGPASLDKQ